MRRSLLLLLYCALALSAAAQSHQHDHEAEVPEKLGAVHFPTSCSAAVQPQFERAVALLHSFAYEDSAKAFSEIASRDPSCSMAHCGIAMSLYHPLWDRPSAGALKQGWDEIQKTHSPAAKTQRERDYTTALESFYRDYDKIDHPTRALKYERAMEQLHARYPDDREATVFYSLALLGAAISLPPDKTYARQRKAGAMLEAVFAAEPNNPGVAHYIIHSYDYPPLASRALPAARSYAQIAPSTPHALHMPSHIFTRLGLWQDSISSNVAAAQAAKDYAVRNHLDGAFHQQLHAMDYLEYGYLQTGQVSEAKKVYDELNTIRKAVPENQNSAYAFAAIPARYTVEQHRWSDAAALSVRPSSAPWTDAITYWAVAVGSARTGQLDRAAENIARLDGLRRGLAKDAYWSTQVEVQQRAAEAWLGHARHNNEKAAEPLREAVG